MGDIPRVADVLKADNARSRWFSRNAVCSQHISVRAVQLQTFLVTLTLEKIRTCKCEQYCAFREFEHEREHFVIYLFFGIDEPNIE